ncbi:MAG: hypothetical protein ABI675_11120 [Chitinophagaceae bacterium]
MKMISVFLFFLLIASFSNGKEKAYTASTPGGNVIKIFLGIPLSDSIDFVRWKLILRDNDYDLQCNYGIGKNNTNGFINGGSKIELKGALKKDKHYYRLQNGEKILNVVELNADLLHLLDENKTLLAGNGGWSYTLNSLAATFSEQVNLSAHPTILKDSMDFEGRTPCKIPGIIPKGMECYKLKWYVIFYTDPKKNKPGSYKIYGTPWRQKGPRTGNWKMVNGKDGRIIYQLNDDNGKGLLYLLKLDENILVFTDADGKLLVGDEDFSYTLNRRSK